MILFLRTSDCIHRFHWKNGYAIYLFCIYSKTISDCSLTALLKESKVETLVYNSLILRVLEITCQIMITTILLIRCETAE